MLYLGEEWGMLNDYDFVKDPAKAGDTRWIHRPKMKWEFLEDLEDRLDEQGGSIRKRIFNATRRLIGLRKELPALGGQQMALIATANEHVLGYVRIRDGNRLVVLANFCEQPQQLNGNHLRTAGLGRFFEDVISGTTFGTSDPVTLQPYQIVWLNRI